MRRENDELNCEQTQQSGFLSNPYPLNPPTTTPTGPCLETMLDNSLQYERQLVNVFGKLFELRWRDKGYEGEERERVWIP
jgi:hypothetical protein